MRSIAAPEVDLGGQGERAGPQAGDRNVRRVEFYASRKELAALQELPQVRPDTSARRAGQHSLAVLGAQLQLVEIQLRSVPTKRGRHMRKRDAVADPVVNPILDLGLILRRAVEGELDRQHQQYNDSENSCAAIEQDLDDLAQRHLHQDDVVLVDGVQSFGLQAYRFAGHQLQFAESRRLLVQQALDHVLMGEDHQLLTLELARLTHNFTKYLVAHRFGRLHETPSFTGGTRLAQQMFQTFTRSLARHFDQSQGRYRRDIRLHVIVAQRPLQGLNDLPAMFRLLHVDEVDDDDAAEIAQAQLPRNGHSRLQIGAENGLFQISVADESARVDVDGGHRFRLVDDEIPARLERYLAIQGLLNFLLDMVQLEQRAGADVQFKTR